MKTSSAAFDEIIRIIGSVKDEFLKRYVCSVSSGMNVIYRPAVHGGTSFGLDPILEQITSELLHTYKYGISHWLACVGYIGNLHLEVL